MQLQYCIQFWTAIKVKDADMLEEVQKKATKIIPSLRNLVFVEIMMFSLRHRRLRGVMIEGFKMINGTDKVNLGKFFFYRCKWKNKQT